MSVTGTVGSRREQAEGRHHASRARTRHDRSFAGQRARERVRNDAVLVAVTITSRDLGTAQVVYPDHEQQQTLDCRRVRRKSISCRHHPTTSALAVVLLVAMMLLNTLCRSIRVVTSCREGVLPRMNVAPASGRELLPINFISRRAIQGLVPNSCFITEHHQSFSLVSEPDPSELQGPERIRVTSASKIEDEPPEGCPDLPIRQRHTGTSRLGNESSWHVRLVK